MATNQFQELIHPRASNSLEAEANSNESANIDASVNAGREPEIDLGAVTEDQTRKPEAATSEDAL